MSAKRKSKPKYRLSFDGLFRCLQGQDHRNSRAGVMCYGWVIEKNAVVIARGHGAVVRGDNATSNIAEYLGLIEGLDALADLGVEDGYVVVNGDSKVVIDQMSGLAGVYAPGMVPLYNRAKRLASRFPNLQWGWMPRKHNRSADQLTRWAMKQIRLDPAGFETALKEIDGMPPGSMRENKMLPLVDLRVYSPAW